METQTIGQVMNQVEQETTLAQPSNNERTQEVCNETERRKQAHIDMVLNAINHVRLFNMTSYDFSDMDIYRAHSRLISACANEILSHHGKHFIIDDNNKNVLKFLMLYFNNSPLALDVFPDKGYSLDKNIMLIGPAGTGKTLMMDVMRLYLGYVNSPLEYKVFSQTQMLNYFKQHNNIDFFTFNSADSKSFEGKPFHVCLNDIGLRTQKFFGNDTERIIEEFLYARYEIWEQNCKRTHITTNLDIKDIKETFSDEHGRLSDRFKMFNVIPLLGNSRR